MGGHGAELPPDSGLRLLPRQVRVACAVVVLGYIRVPEFKKCDLSLPPPIPPITTHTHHQQQQQQTNNSTAKTAKLLLALANNSLETYTLDLEAKTYERLSSLDGPGHRYVFIWGCMRICVYVSVHPPHVPPRHHLIKRADDETIKRSSTPQNPQKIGLTCARWR